MQTQIKTSSTSFIASLRRLALLTTAITFGVASLPMQALADPGLNELPTGFNVAAGNGSANIGPSPNSNTMNINQQSQNVIINWNTYNIGQNATVNYNQPNSSAIALNQVNGQADPSQILGALNSNGIVYILNPNGVMFGQGAQVNVGGILASTGHIDEDNFMAGSTSIQLTNMNAGASVVNNGHITAADGGMVALIGAQSANNGVIVANQGTVILGGAKAATLDFYGDGLINFKIDEASELGKGNVVSNSGTIQADNGTVLLMAEDAKNTVSNVINMDGIIQAHGGRVVLNAGKKGRANIKIGGDSDTIKSVNNSRRRGIIDVSKSNGQGGSIEMSGGYIDLQKGTVLNANGSTGGGNIHLVANSGPLNIFGPKILQGISVGPKVTISADATNSGAGGLIHLETNKNLTSQGNYSARGFDANNAGMVWLQADGKLSYTGFSDLSGQNGGATGTLRLQAPDLVVASSGGAITGDLLSKQLYYANVDLRGQTITVNDAVNASSGNTLFFTAGNSNFAGNPILDALFGHGYVFINNAFNVTNVGLQSPSQSGITVAGSQLANAVVQNLYLNTPVLLLSSVINAPNQIVVGRTKDDNGNVQSTGIIQQAFNWVATGGTVLLNGSFNQNATANHAFNFGSYGIGGFMNHLTINDNGFNILTDGSGETQVQANRVTLNADNSANHLLQNAYNMIKNTAGGMLRLGLAFYNDTLNHTSSGATVVGINGAPSTINDLTLTAVGGTLTNINGNTVRENSGSNAQRAVDLTNINGKTEFGTSYYPENINVNKNISLIGAAGGTLFNTIDINNGSAGFSNILGNVVNAFQGTAQNAYNITANIVGVLNLFQSNYGQLVADKSITINGAAGTGSHFDNFITINALGNVFNNISTPVTNVNAVGAGQQAVALTDTGGVVNFGYSNSGETITLDRDITLIGAAGGTTVGNFNINTLLGNFNNFFGTNVFLNTTDNPLRGANATQTNGNLFLSFDSYAYNLNAGNRPINIWGTINTTFFTGLINTGGATLHRIRFPGVGGPGDVNNNNPPNTNELLNGAGTQTLESLLSALSPAGPDEEGNVKVCTAKGADAAAECIADAMGSGKTVVVFDITNNKYAVVEENATGQLVDWRPVSQEEIEKLLGHSLDI